MIVKQKIYKRSTNHYSYVYLHTNAQILVTKGKAEVNLERTNDGWVAPHGLFSFFLKKKVLITKGKADVNLARTDDGWVALMGAATNGHT